MKNFTLSATVWKNFKADKIVKHFSERAADEHSARRQLLNRLIQQGYVVSDITVQHADV